MTNGCKEADFMGFSHYIYENELNSEFLIMKLEEEKKQFYFLFFIVDSQYPKFSLKYLTNIFFLNCNASESIKIKKSIGEIGKRRKKFLENNSV